MTCKGPWEAQWGAVGSWSNVQAVVQFPLSNNKKQNFFDFHQPFFIRAKNGRQDAIVAPFCITRWEDGEDSRKERGLWQAFGPFPTSKPHSTDSSYLGEEDWIQCSLRFETQHQGFHGETQLGRALQLLPQSY